MSSPPVDLTPARWARVEELFDAAAELPAAERAAYLQRACAGDAGLRDYILSLLDTDLAEVTVIEEAIRGALGQAMDGFAESEHGAGERVGPYRIVRTIGTGGMGIVYLAERADQQFEQQVAIKLVRQRLLDPEVERRLVAERQILANLDHPNIARLFDGGTMPDGTPYLVMEYIDGVPIDRYCDQNRLGIHARLQLIRTVCSAIHYAHQTLVVHRDIKPSNILVTADGVPKLLDFGIARILDASGDSTAGITRDGAVILTPENAAPEQVRGEAITTATDTYALGVLMYRLLTGCPPYQVSMNRPAEIPAIICDVEPLPPSQKVRRLASPLPSGNTPPDARQVLNARGMSAERLARRLRGDLDNIVLMALRKDPKRRYRTVNEFAGDIERHLSSHPVLARPDTWHYRSSRFLRRHVAAVSATASLCLLLIMFAISTGIQNRKIAEQRDTAMEISAFLEDIFREPDPGNARGASITAREILEKGANQITNQLGDRPAIQATLMSTIGRVYYNLGEYDNSAELLQESLRIRRDVLNDQEGGVAVTKSELAVTLMEKAEYDESLRLLTEAIDENRKRKGAGSADLANNYFHLAEVYQLSGESEQAERYARDSIDMFTALGTQYAKDIAEAKNLLARVLQRSNKLDEAELLLSEAIELVKTHSGSDDPLLAYYSQNYAVLLQTKGELDRAEETYYEAIAITRKILGDEHSLLGGSLVMLGRLLHSREEYAEAEIAFRDALRVHRKARGDTHPFVGYDKVSLGMLLHDMGRLEEAEQQIREALGIYEESLGGEHQYIASALTALCAVLNDAGRAEEGRPLIERALAIRSKDYNARHPLLASTQNVAGRNLAVLGDFAAAEPLLVDSLEILKEQDGPDSQRVRRARGWLRDMYVASGQQKKADRYRDPPVAAAKPE
jgi:eukaryotic-like serine/threonine-protein kinase